VCAFDIDLAGRGALVLGWVVRSAKVGYGRPTRCAVAWPVAGARLLQPVRAALALPPCHSHFPALYI
jgi:hypothetical protein